MSIEKIYKLFLSCKGGISKDTRKITKDSMYFAFKGANFDGNKFAKEALRKGAKYAIVDDETIKGENIIYTSKGSLRCLQELANHHRKAINIPIIALTGSNGKTTTKELIAAVLKQQHKLTYTQGNLNNHIGVPLTLLNIKADDDMAIIEMGANHPGEIAQLCEIAEPEYGLITNIGKAHLEGFGSFEGVKKTKKELYDYILKGNGTFFYNIDNKLISSFVESKSTKSYSFNDDANCIGKIKENNTGLINLDVYFNNFLTKSLKKLKGNISINSNLPGKYNAENIMFSVIVGAYFEVTPKQISQAINSYIPDNNRSQLSKTDKNLLFLDAYNANPTSMKGAIETFINDSRTNKIMILGDMLELGEHSYNEHQFIYNIAKESGINFYTVGKEFMKINTNKNAFENVDDAIKFFKENLIKNKFIILKGSRSIMLEKLIPFL